MLECTSPSGNRQAAQANIATHILSMETDVPCSDIFRLKIIKKLITCLSWEGKILDQFYAQQTLPKPKRGN